MLDEDTQRLKKRYRLFLNKASKVLTRWLTSCGRTLTGSVAELEVWARGGKA